MKLYIDSIRFVAQPDGVRCMDGIIGTGSARAEYALLKGYNEYGGKYNYRLTLEPTTNPHSGYENRILSEEELRYPEAILLTFRRPLVEGEESHVWDVAPRDEIRALCPIGEDGFPMAPIGSVSFHEVTIWGQGTWTPEGRRAFESREANEEVA